MAVRGYAKWNPTGETGYWFNRAAAVLRDYRQEWPLSNRQLFYRMVAEHEYAKDEKAYGKLVDMVARGRRAGLLPWEAIRDGGLGDTKDADYFANADHFMRSVRGWADEMSLDRQKGQDKVIELWCEAGGMFPILQGIAAPYSCRANTGGGYDSVTAKHNLAVRVRERARHGLPTLILHVGDFDPSGEDMCNTLREDAGEMALAQVLRAANRDTTEGPVDWVPDLETVLLAQLRDGDKLTGAETQRLARWARGFLTVERVALTGEQVVDRQVITAPPKRSDSRRQGFIENNWEIVEALGTEDISAQLEALTPQELRELVTEVIEDHLDMAVYERALRDEQEVRDDLSERLS